jgi:hypothetical protein
VFFYLGFQLISIPFAMTYREQFVGVLDGLASVVPLLVAAVAIVGHPELLKTSGRWEGPSYWFLLAWPISSVALQSPSD